MAPASGSFSHVSDEAAIQTSKLRKSFGDIHALRAFDLEVESATVFGLLGPNGAGKTTAVRILTTLLRPDGGTARVAGLDIVRDAHELRAQIGLAGQNAAVDEMLTGFENLEMVGRLYHLGRRTARARADELLESFDLTDAGRRSVGTYSGGMRRRLDLAAALVARPPVLFLDEPTTGLDIRSRLELWAAIEELVREGTTVLLTTQYLDEADRLADRIAVIDNGMLIAQGTPNELKTRVGGDRLEVSLERQDDGEHAVRALQPLASEQAACVDGTVRVPLRIKQGAIAEAVRALDRAGVGIDDIHVSEPTLDDVFLELTGRATGDDEDSGSAEGADGR